MISQRSVMRPRAPNVTPFTNCESSWLNSGGMAVASTVKMTFLFSVLNTALFSESRPLAKSHFVPTSKLADSWGSTLGLLTLFGCALSAKFAPPGGVALVPYET